MLISFVLLTFWLLIFLSVDVDHEWEGSLHTESFIPVWTLCSALPQRSQGHVSLLIEPVLCCFAVLSHLPSLLNRKTSPAAIVLHLRHTRCTQASQVRECPGESYSSVPIACCLFVFLYSWIWSEAVVGSQVFVRMLWLEAVLWV